MDAQIISGVILRDFLLKGDNKMKTKNQNNLEFVDKRICICIECGSLAIEKTGTTGQCRDCGKKFSIGEKVGPSL